MQFGTPVWPLPPFLLVQYPFYPKSRGRNALTAALRTSTGAGQSRAVTEDESAVQTFTGCHQKFLGLVPADSFENMSQVVLHLPFRNTDELCQLPGGEDLFSEDSPDLLTWCLFWGNHRIRQLARFEFRVPSFRLKTGTVLNGWSDFGKITDHE